MVVIPEDLQTELSSVLYPHQIEYKHWPMCNSMHLPMGHGPARTPFDISCNTFVLPAAPTGLRSSTLEYKRVLVHVELPINRFAETITCDGQEGEIMTGSYRRMSSVDTISVRP